MQFDHIGHFDESYIYVGGHDDKWVECLDNIQILQVYGAPYIGKTRLVKSIVHKFGKKVNIPGGSQMHLYMIKMKECNSRQDFIEEMCFACLPGSKFDTNGVEGAYKILKQKLKMEASLFIVDGVKGNEKALPEIMQCLSDLVEATDKIKFIITSQVHINFTRHTKYAEHLCQPMLPPDAKRLFMAAAGYKDWAGEESGYPNGFSKESVEEVIKLSKMFPFTVIRAGEMVHPEAVELRYDLDQVMELLERSVFNTFKNEYAPTDDQLAPKLKEYFRSMMDSNETKFVIKLEQKNAVSHFTPGIALDANPGRSQAEVNLDILQPMVKKNLLLPKDKQQSFDSICWLEDQMREHFFEAVHSARHVFGQKICDLISKHVKSLGIRQHELDYVFSTKHQFAQQLKEALFQLIQFDNDLPKNEPDTDTKKNVMNERSALHVQVIRAAVFFLRNAFHESNPQEFSKEALRIMTEVEDKSRGRFDTGPKQLEGINVPHQEPYPDPEPIAEVSPTFQPIPATQTHLIQQASSPLSSSWNAQQTPLMHDFVYPDQPNPHSLKDKELPLAPAPPPCVVAHDREVNNSISSMSTVADQTRLASQNMGNPAEQFVSQQGYKVKELSGSKEKELPSAPVSPPCVVAHDHKLNNSISSMSTVADQTKLTSQNLRHSAENVQVLGQQGLSGKSRLVGVSDLPHTLKSSTSELIQPQLKSEEPQVAEPVVNSRIQNDMVFASRSHKESDDSEIHPLRSHPSQCTPSNNNTHSTADHRACGNEAPALCAQYPLGDNTQERASNANKQHAGKQPSRTNQTVANRTPMMTSCNQHSPVVQPSLDSMDIEDGLRQLTLAQSDIGVPSEPSTFNSEGPNGQVTELTSNNKPPQVSRSSVHQTGQFQVSAQYNSQEKQSGPEEVDTAQQAYVPNDVFNEDGSCYFIHQPSGRSTRSSSAPSGDHYMTYNQGPQPGQSSGSRIHSFSDPSYVQEYDFQRTQRNREQMLQQEQSTFQRPVLSSQQGNRNQKLGSEGFYQQGLPRQPFQFQEHPQPLPHQQQLQQQQQRPPCGQPVVTSHQYYGSSHKESPQPYQQHQQLNPSSRKAVPALSRPPDPGTVQYGTVQQNMHQTSPNRHQYYGPSHQEFPQQYQQQQQQYPPTGQPYETAQQYGHNQTSANCHYQLGGSPHQEYPRQQNPPPGQLAIPHGMAHQQRHQTVQSYQNYVPSHQDSVEQQQQSRPPGQTILYDTGHPVRYQPPAIGSSHHGGDPSQTPQQISPPYYNSQTSPTAFQVSPPHYSPRQISNGHQHFSPPPNYATNHQHLQQAPPRQQVPSQMMQHFTQHHGGHIQQHMPQRSPHQTTTQNSPHLQQPGNFTAPYQQMPPPGGSPNNALGDGSLPFVPNQYSPHQGQQNYFQYPEQPHIPAAAMYPAGSGIPAQEHQRHNQQMAYGNSPSPR